MYRSFIFYSCQILIELQHFRQTFKSTQTSNFINIRPVRTDPFRTDGQTDGQTDGTKLTDALATLRTRRQHYTALELCERKIHAFYTELRLWKLCGYLEIRRGVMNYCICVLNCIYFPIQLISRKLNRLTIHVSRLQTFYYITRTHNTHNFNTKRYNIYRYGQK